MKITVRNAYWKLLEKAGGTKIDDWHYREDDTFSVIDTNRLTENDLKLLKEIADKAYKASKESGSLGLIRKINAWSRVHEDVEGAKISDLNSLVDAIKVYFGSTPNKWVFLQEDDGEMIPYFVVGAVYHEPEPEKLSPASTRLTLSSMFRGQQEEKTFTFHRDELGKTISELLRGHKVYRETPEMVKGYEAEVAKYKAICGNTGEQYIATGRAFWLRGYYDNTLIEMEVDGEPSRVVLDEYGDGDEDEDRRSSRHKLSESIVDAKFWRKGQQKHKHDEDEDEGDVAVLPTQPYICIFDLKKHRHVVSHVNNLEPYAYDEKMVDKLILPEADKDLVHILVQGVDEQMEDIVKGKTGGIIVIATGPPGTGKTLTAETFSECVKRPLYSVQCSQLGTTPDGLEKKLTVTLNRAARWKAILLIDEADVYIHERGSDVAQNAIVGVWLRILEYYKGIMFMTSNRDVIIDDAILSRATAWIRYEYPTKEALLNIWKVLSTQYRLTLTLQTMEKLVIGKLKHVSGRTVKNLLKLARLLSLRKKVPVSVNLIEYVSQYLDIEIEDENVNASSNNDGRKNDSGRGLNDRRETRRSTRKASMVLNVGADT